MRNEISCLEHLKIGMLWNTKVSEKLIMQYHLKIKSIAELIEMLKQRVTLTTKKLKSMKIIQQKYQISSGKISGKILNNTIPKQTGLNRLNQY